ncbi:hypothetical protein ACOKW7_12620 [Limnospira platensis CENA597]|uniref:hypothetical protein n=1 Tax=Limnospira platensis TaxID=118562 RepID=UPI003D6E5A61
MVQEIQRQNSDVNLAEQVPMEPLAIDVHADQFIDDIFQDIDRSLSGITKLPKDPVQPEFVSLQSIKVPQIILPSLETEADSEVAISAETQLRDANADRSHSFDRILLAAACASLVVTLSLWMATRGGLGRLFAPAPVAVDPQLSQQTQADAKFVNYLQRSLEAISRNKAGATQPGMAQGIPGAPPMMELPTLAIPDTPAPAPAPDAAALANTNNLIAAINRVAEAVQEASNQTAALSNQVMASLQAQNQQNQQPAPQPQATTPGGQASGVVPETTASSSPAPTTTEETTASTPVSIPDPPAIPTPPTAPPEETAAVSPDTTTSPAAAIHTLVGILELGDRSAALFEVNGVARRIYVGESIAASGWSLSSVANQEAVIRRNGEVRSIVVGERF